MSIDELLTVVNIALGDAVVECVAGDADHDGEIEVDEIINAVNTVLNGCAPMPTVTASPTFTAPLCGDGHIQPPEECDDGNTTNGDGCTNCRVDAGYACYDEPSQCFIVVCSGPNPTCSGGPSAPAPTATPPPPPMNRTHP